MNRDAVGLPNTVRHATSADDYRDPVARGPETSMPEPDSTPPDRLPTSEPAPALRVSSETQDHVSHSSELDSEAALGRAITVASATKAAAPFRFRSGQLLADRYRIVSILGRGGMGEVYRADDLALGVPVALKFLPSSVAASDERLARFRKEIAAARQVSHPNVCRVYDIAEADGQVFLSMEFITGDTLAALRQSGRVAPSLAIDLGRQIALGLHAVHEEGLVHRDLKPANVMLDGRGRAKLTDFGLAANAADVIGAEAHAGTPAYQAPEQLAGEGVSDRTDLYAFGVLLYELLTGRRPFVGTSRSDLLRLQRTARPVPPSELTPGVPADVDRIVLRCLAPLPADRPASAHEVWRALPGNDALLAVLAAGQTPSADLVANAGGEGRLSRKVALGLLAVFAVFLAVVLVLKERSATLRVVPFPVPPADLTARAKAILGKLGHTAPMGESSGHFVQQYDYEDWSLLHDRTPQRWGAMADGRAGLLFRYQQAADLFLGLSVRVSDRALASTEPGWATLFLDPAGRLVRLSRVAWPGHDTTVTEPDWTALFGAADLDRSGFVATDPDPQWDPSVPIDHRVAWVGAYPGRPEWPLRIEAGSHRGSPVYFRCVPPWDVPPARSAWGTANRVSPFAGWLLDLTLILVGSLLAVWNLRRERVDLSGTAVMVLGTTAAWFLGLALGMDHAPDYRTELDRLSHVLGIAVFSGAKLGIAYLALEPYVRRHWPWQLVGWARLLAGRWRDPHVGSDILIGVAGGVVFATGYLVLLEMPGWLGLPKNPRYVMAFATAPFSEAPFLLGHAITRATLVFFAAFLLFRVFRKAWLGFIATVIVATAFLANYSTDSPWIYYAGCGMLGVFGVSILLRFGLLTGIVTIFTHYFVCRSLMTWDLATWYWWGTLLHFGTLVALVGYGWIGAVGRWHRHCAPARAEE
jgi:Protein kinase domain